MATEAIILFVSAIVLAIISIMFALYTKVPEYLLFIWLSIILCVIGIAVQYPAPNKDDVKEGNAHYVEKTHIEIVNGDTINNYKTYKIEWNQN